MNILKIIRLLKRRKNFFIFSQKFEFFQKELNTITLKEDNKEKMEKLHFLQKEILELIKLTSENTLLHTLNLRESFQQEMEKVKKSLTKKLDVVTLNYQNTKVEKYLEQKINLQILLYFNKNISYSIFYIYFLI